MSTVIFSWVSTLYLSAFRMIFHTILSASSMLVACVVTTVAIALMCTCSFWNCDSKL